MNTPIHFSTERQPIVQQWIDQADSLWQQVQGMPTPRPLRERTAFAGAVRRAYRRFARQRPRWAHSLFDDYFLLHGAAPVLRSIEQKGRWPTAYELALAWYAQFERPMDAEHAAQIEGAVPVAALFLSLLREEWPVKSPADATQHEPVAQ
jgi:hypothetical protein